MNRTPLLIEELKTVKRPPRILYRSCKSKSPALWKNTKIYFTVDHYTGMPLKGGVRIDSGFLMDGRFVSGQCHHFTKGFDVCQNALPLTVQAEIGRASCRERGWS